MCGSPGCPNVIEGQALCDECRRAKDLARGTSKERGYDSAHIRGRAKLKPTVDAGEAVCWRCGQPITPGELWDYGHDDDDRTVHRGAEHMACNRATKTHMVQRT